jgi:ThiF family
VGRLILVDPERVEEKNLNRILNATMDDAVAGRYKVHVAADAVNRMKLGTVVIPIPENIINPGVVRIVAESDVVIGTMDGAEGRNLLNRLATFYCIPYFDVGVRLEADGCGGISQICGSVNYLQPGGSSLLSRKAITPEDIAAEGLRRTDPAAYVEQVKARYIKGVQEDRPAVVSVNMHYASLAVNELLARLHPYRDDWNEGFAWFGSSLTQARFFQASDGEPCRSLSRHVGRGDVTPLLDMPALSE